MAGEAPQGQVLSEDVAEHEQARHELGVGQVADVLATGAVLAAMAGGHADTPTGEQRSQTNPEPTRRWDERWAG